MRKFKNLHRKEQVEYIAVLALFPLFLLFQWLGKSIKCLSTKQRQLTASVLCALLIIGMFPLTVFADSGKLTVVTEFNVNNNKIDVGNSPDNYWSYGTNTAVIAKNVASLPEDGWTWAIQTKLSTAEYTIKLNNYNGSYIIASNIHSYSNNNCSVNLELSGQNTITSPYYGLRFSLCDIFMHGNGSLKIDVTKTSSAVDTHSLTVDLPSNKALDISASSSSEIGSNGIHVSSDFTLNSGTVNVNITSSSTSEKYGAVGISAATLTVNSGALNIASSNSNTDGISYGIRGNSTYNEEKREYEYPAKVYFNGGSVEISAGTKATDTFYAPETSDDFTLWAGKAADKSDKKIYDPAKFDSYLYYTTEHKHCKCGAVDTHDESNLCFSYYPQTYKPWTDSSSLPTYGYYYLSTDVTLSKTWEITETVNLCLNGHSIIADGDFDAIKISSSLNLTDCAPTEKQGKITHTPGTEGRGIVTEKANNYSTRLYMYGGNITGNTAENGAGIYCAANICIRIKGGSITNNIATGNGGGIYCEGDMDIDDGNITGNTATIGGGIYVTKGSDTYSDSDALRITGGNITGNTATEKGGGVYANHYVVLRGYVNYIKNPYGLPLCTATVLNNTSGPEGNKKTDNISFAPGQYLNIYNNFKGGNVSLNFTGAGTKIAIPYGNLTSKLWVNDLILSGIHCDDPKYSPVIDKTNNAVLLRSSLKYLSASDFEFTAPRGFTYTGEAKTATVTAKDGINCGTITVKYFDENHRQVYAPTEAGKYTVSIDVEENDTYAALTGIHDENWTFTITPKEISYSKILITGIDDTYIYTGSAIEPTAYVTVESMGLYQGRDYTISYKNNTEVGTATVVITLKGNYSGSRQTDFSITYGHASEIMYSMPAANANGWYSSDIIVTAINGYKIGETAQSFSDTLTLTGDTAKGGKQVFLKATDGKVYRTILQYKIDTVSPTDVAIQYNENGFKSFLNKLTFGLFFKDTVKVEATATDALSGVDKILYYAADGEVSDPSSITDWQESLRIEAGNKKLIYVKVTDKAGNSIILLDQGLVVYRDSTVSPTTATFDRKVDKRSDITFTINLNGNTFSAIKNEDSLLVEGTDYTVSGNTVTVSKNYLSRFDIGSVQTLLFLFNPLGEEGQTVSIAAVRVSVTDSTHYHSPEKHINKSASCTENGNIEYYSCSGCNGLFKDFACTQAITVSDTVIPAFHHEGAVFTDAVDAKCVTDGNLAYWYCRRCNKYFADSNGTLNTEQSFDSKIKFEKKALGHDWGKWNITTASTFTESGEETRSCGRCSLTDRKEIAKLIPMIIKGQNDSFRKNEDSSLSFSCNMSLDKNTVISIDGAKLATNAYRLDNENALTLLDSYLYMLSAGSHSIKIQTADGSAETVFTVIAAQSSPSESGDAGSDKSPQTFDNSNLVLWIALLFASGCTLAGAALIGTKKKFFTK